MQVNYIAEMNAFFSWITETEPSAGAQLLWHALMSIANSRGDGSEWPERIRISNRKLLLLLPFSEDSLARAREELAALGRIDYVPGTRTERPSYRIVYFCPASGSAASAADTPCEAPQQAPCRGPQNPDESAEPFHTDTKYDTHTAEEECCSLRKEAEAACAEILHEKPREAALRRLLIAAKDFHAAPALLREAILQAAENNDGNPLRYAQALLQGWCDAGYRTPEDVLDGQVLRYQQTWRASAPLDEPLPDWLKR